ncbi:MAG: NUDIX hydrolase [Anaerolineales bacterium]|nr:NUDIX hydrolase [Anaerolineales bacterium]
MASLTKYFKLMKEHPQLFVNPDEEGIIRIITEREELRRLQAKLKKEYKEVGKKPEWIDIGILAEDQWEYIVRDLVEHPDGRIGGYTRSISRASLKGGIGVVVMPVQGDKVLLLKHFRHETRSWYWEFPRGFGEPGLSAEENAKKELLEEVALSPKRLVEVGSDPGTVFYYAELNEGEPQKPADEAIQKIELLNLDELENWIFSGQITDWFTIMAYIMYKRKTL